MTIILGNRHACSFCLGWFLLRSCERLENRNQECKISPNYRLTLEAVTNSPNCFDKLIFLAMMIQLFSDFIYMDCHS